VVFDIRSLTPGGEPAASGVSLPPAAGSGYVLFANPDAQYGVEWVDLGTELATWVSAATAAGGTFTASSKPIAAKLLRGIREASYDSKIKYLAPFLGGNLATARVPLRDSLGVGIATNVGFAEGDFSETTGLQGSGSGKYLDSLIKPSQLGTTSNGGLGWWETNFTGTGNVEPIGSYGAGGINRYVIDLRSTATFFSWGDVSNRATVSVTATNSHYYGQRDSATSRALYKDGVSIATSAVSDASGGSSDNNIVLCGSNEAEFGVAPWPGRGAVAYLTDGTMTAGEITAFHTLLDETLITPLGRG
jgi:hypothetical protein